MTSRWKDPDETGGRALYRALADAEARRSINMARRVRMAPIVAAPKASPQGNSGNPPTNPLPKV